MWTEPAAVVKRPTRARRTILVVEDEPLIRWSIRQALRENYAVRLAPSAEAAIQSIRRLKRLDAILADIRLPGMSGLEFARKAREIRPELKVFLMTAYNQDTSAREAFGVRAEGYLTKPFEMETLRDMLASHLGMNSSA